MPFGAIGSILGGIFGSSAKKKEIAYQREFAQHGIRWRVNDAQKAGIHPLAALGANIPSYQPVGLGDDLSRGFSEAGQSLDRAMQAKQSAPERAMARESLKLDLERKRLENENLATSLAASRLALVNQPGNPPPMPSITAKPESSVSNYLQGQGNASDGATKVTDIPLERTYSDASRPWNEAGAVNEVGYARTPTGWAVVPSQDVKQRLEDDMLSQVPWHIRNRLAQSFQRDLNPPFPAPAGKYWRFNPWKQEYQLNDVEPIGPVIEHSRTGKGARLPQWRERR